MPGSRKDPGHTDIKCKTAPTESLLQDLQGEMQAACLRFRRHVVRFFSGWRWGLTFKSLRHFSRNRTEQKATSSPPALPPISRFSLILPNLFRAQKSSRPSRGSGGKKREKQPVSRSGSHSHLKLVLSFSIAAEKQLIKEPIKS